jgi:ferric-dicitrate binding protein FerR (iron transport regulator)
MRSSRLWAAGVLLVLVAVAQAAAAKDISIRIDRIAGSVEVMSADGTHGAWQAAERFQDIGTGWQLRTGEGSKAMLVFPMGNIVLLRENSVLTVDKLGWKEGTRLNLTAGGLVADLRSALSPGAEFSVQSESALAAVRGTNFAVDYRKDEQGQTFVWFCCYRGSVELSNAYGPSQMMDEGTFTTVKPGEAVKAPVPSTPKATQFMEKIIDTAAFEAAEQALP